MAASMDLNRSPIRPLVGTHSPDESLCLHNRKYNTFVNSILYTFFTEIDSRKTTDKKMGGLMYGEAAETCIPFTDRLICRIHDIDFVYCICDRLQPKFSPPEYMPLRRLCTYGFKFMRTVMFWELSRVLVQLNVLKTSLAVRYLEEKSI
ncbi:unnamed protein product [Medioppia subpectinata]|uniref:Uncharacterized protein n=1 Tax=Medioppia subpectinata TaxID=1979941 RepID=A0A7R9KWE4_9ACAR|nr:unnamed protein product [Medioppia subpectinata]CAG2110753.1 unnamed protein product [Medioppia subpectinata]